VHKPKWLFLDEATSAVDEPSEVRLYTLVRERLPGTTVFSIGHRATLRPFHARRLLLQPNGNGSASIVELTPRVVSPLPNGQIRVGDGAVAMAG
jgi:putative ATP-binding cassette transporter